VRRAVRHLAWLGRLAGALPLHSFEEAAKNAKNPKDAKEDGAIASSSFLAFFACLAFFAMDSSQGKRSGGTPKRR